MKRTSTAVSEIHLTQEGPVHLWASPDKEGGWKARFWGIKLASASHFKTVEQANRYLTDSFHRRFPQHQCAEKCGTAGEIAQWVGAAEFDFWA